MAQALTDPAPSTNHCSEALVRSAELADLPALQGIAGHSHTDSRFYADAHFPRHLCDALYSTWITRSCTGALIWYSWQNQNRSQWATYLVIETP